MKGSMACFNTQVLLKRMLHLKSKNYSHSRRNLCQRREKESHHVALHSAKRKLHSWVNLGRSEQTFKQNFKGQRCTHSCANHSSWQTSPDVLQTVESAWDTSLSFKWPWKKHRWITGSLMPELHRGYSTVPVLLHLKQHSGAWLALKCSTGISDLGIIGIQAYCKVHRLFFCTMTCDIQHL